MRKTEFVSRTLLPSRIALKGSTCKPTQTVKGNLRCGWGGVGWGGVGGLMLFKPQQGDAECWSVQKDGLVVGHAQKE